MIPTWSKDLGVVRWEKIKEVLKKHPDYRLPTIQELKDAGDQNTNGFAYSGADYWSIQPDGYGKNLVVMFPNGSVNTENDYAGPRTRLRLVKK